MPIEHFGLGVPDVPVAKAYYDEFMPMVGYMPYFGTGYVPTNWQGAQLFLYPTVEEGPYSRHRTGLQHISFLVPTREDVQRVHDWAQARGHEILHAPRAFPEYGKNCFATYFLDLHGFMLEAVCHAPPGDPAGAS